MQRVSVKVSGGLLAPHCFCFCIFGLGLLLVCMAGSQEELDLNWKSKTDWNSLILLCGQDHQQAQGTQQAEARRETGLGAGEAGRVAIRA